MPSHGVSISNFQAPQRGPGHPGLAPVVGPGAGIAPGWKPIAAALWGRAPPRRTNLWR